MLLIQRFSRSFSMLLIAVLLITGCSLSGVNDPGKPQTQTQTVDAGSATAAKVKIMLDLGELNIDGGAAQLLEGKFDYNFTDLQPHIEYVQDGNTGSLLIDQPTKKATSSYRNAQILWNLHLNNSIPIDLDVSTGAGVTNLDLTTVDLVGLKLAFGVGSGDIDLSSGWSHDVSVDVKGGVGEITVTLPQRMGTRVEVRSGIGKISASGLNRDGDAYVNDTYGKTAQTLNLSIEPGVGEVFLKVK